MYVLYFMPLFNFYEKRILHAPQTLLCVPATSCIMPTFMRHWHFMNPTHLCVPMPLHDKLSLLCILYTSCRCSTTAESVYFMLAKHFNDSDSLHVFIQPPW